MKEKVFITVKNLPKLRNAFAASVTPYLQENNDADLNISVIGEPGVGKSFITTKLSKGVLGQNTTTSAHAVERENMHDLILWSTHTNGTQQIIQYDEASRRFVDEEYHNFVQQEQQKNPTPERKLPGLTFIEHPNLDTEQNSDITVRICFSERQQAAIENVRQKMENSTHHITIHKKALSKIAAMGCQLEIETNSDKIDQEPLEKFFNEYGILPEDTSQYRAEAYGIG